VIIRSEQQQQQGESANQIEILISIIHHLPIPDFQNFLFYHNNPFSSILLPPTCYEFNEVRFQLRASFLLSLFQGQEEISNRLKFLFNSVHKN